MSKVIKYPCVQGSIIQIRSLIKKFEESLKNLVVPGILFDELGFRYFGPIDGHNVDLLVNTLQNIKDIKTPVQIPLNSV